ncbi:hypothetical protein ACRC7T_13915 [Segnochrobactraceae bacterium EtOH-i3]
MGAFADACSAWARESKARMTGVFRQSAQTVYTEIQKSAKLPKVTGNLRRSLLVSTAAMPLQAEPKVEFKEEIPDRPLAIATATLDDTIFVGLQANYAHRVNYGFVGVDSIGRKYDQKGAHFIEDVIDRWPEIVKSAAAKVEADSAAWKAGKAPT